MAIFLARLLVQYQNARNGQLQNYDRVSSFLGGYYYYYYYYYKNDKQRFREYDVLLVQQLTRKIQTVNMKERLAITLGFRATVDSYHSTRYCTCLKLQRSRYC
jgi:hypothetical protein